MTGFETEVIKQIAVLETKMEMMISKVDDLCNKTESTGMSGLDKIKFGGLLTALTTLATIAATAIQSGMKP